MELSLIICGCNDFDTCDSQYIHEILENLPSKMYTLLCPSDTFKDIISEYLYKKNEQCMVIEHYMNH